MRALIRAYSASHPIITAAFLAIRWTLWFAAGHLLFVLIGLVAMVFGVALIAAAAFAALAEAAIFAVGAHRVHGPARYAWVWAQGMAFRRRWPSAFAEAYVQPEFDRAAIFPGNYYSAPDGLRPVLVAPRLPFLPAAIGQSSVRWAARPWSAQSFGQNVAQISRLARADDRVLRAELTRHGREQRLSQHRRRWQLTVVFAEPTQDPGDGFSAVEAGYTPAASGDGSGVVPPPRRSQRSNGAVKHKELRNKRRIEKEPSTHNWRVVHDVRNRASNKG